MYALGKWWFRYITVSSYEGVGLYIPTLLALIGRWGAKFPKKNVLRNTWTTHKRLDYFPFISLRKRKNDTFDVTP